MFLTVTSLGFLPSALVLWARVAGALVRDRAVAAHRAAHGAARRAQAYAARGAVLAAAAVVALLALAGGARIQVDSDFLNYFDRVVAGAP